MPLILGFPDGGGGGGQPTNILSSTLTVGGSGYSRTVDLPEFDAALAYTAGMLVTHNNTLWKAAANVPAGAWDETQWQQIGGATGAVESYHLHIDGANDVIATISLFVNAFENDTYTEMDFIRSFVHVDTGNYQPGMMEITLPEGHPPIPETFWGRSIDMPLNNNFNGNFTGGYVGLYLYNATTLYLMLPDIVIDPTAGYSAEISNGHQRIGNLPPAGVESWQLQLDGADPVISELSLFVNAFDKDGRTEFDFTQLRITIDEGSYQETVIEIPIPDGQPPIPDKFVGAYVTVPLNESSTSLFTGRYAIVVLQTPATVWIKLPGLPGDTSTTGYYAAITGGHQFFSNFQLPDNSPLEQWVTVTPEQLYDLTQQAGSPDFPGWYPVEVRATVSTAVPVTITRLTLTESGISASQLNVTIPVGEHTLLTDPTYGPVKYRLRWNLAMYGVSASITVDGDSESVTSLYISSVSTVIGLGDHAYIDSVENLTIDIANFDSFRALLRRNP